MAPNRRALCSAWRRGTAKNPVMCQKRSATWELPALLIRLWDPQTGSLQELKGDPIGGSRWEAWAEVGGPPVLATVGKVAFRFGPPGGFRRSTAGRRPRSPRQPAWA
jgi:hypothetical protein